MSGAMFLLCWLFVWGFPAAELTGCCYCRVAQSYLTLCNPMDCSTPGLPVYHQLPESTQTHVHCVSDAIQPFHPLSTPSPPALNLFQHQDLFQWMGSSHQVAKFIGVSASASVLPMNIQDWFPLRVTVLISPAPQFESINSSVLSLLYGPTFTSVHDYWKNHSFYYMDV